MNQLRYLILAIFLLLGLDSFSQLNHKYFIMMGRIDLSEESYSMRCTISTRPSQPSRMISKATF